MSALLVVRHGYFLGQALTRDGIEKTEELAVMLATEIGGGEVRILTSGFKPALQTSAILAYYLDARIRTWSELGKLIDLPKCMRFAKRCVTRLGKKNTLILVLGNSCCSIPLGEKQILWWSEGLRLSDMKRFNPYTLSTNGASPPG